jgi:hypothetical protein
MVAVICVGDDIYAAGSHLEWVNWGELGNHREM